MCFDSFNLHTIVSLYIQYVVHVLINVVPQLLCSRVPFLPDAWLTSVQHDKVLSLLSAFLNGSDSSVWAITAAEMKSWYSSYLVLILTAKCLLGEFFVQSVGSPRIISPLSKNKLQLRGLSTA